jgi:hypothetical protein
MMTTFQQNETYLGLLESFWRFSVNNCLELKPGESHYVFRDSVQELLQVTEVAGGVGPDRVADGVFGSCDAKPEVITFLRSVSQHLISSI